MQCEMLCSHPPPHSSLTHAHSSSRGQVSSSATAIASANRGRGGGGGGEEPLLSKMAKEWMSTRDLMKVCVCVRACVSVCVCVCVCVFVMSNKVDTLSYYLTPLGSVCHMRLALILPQ